MAESLNRKACDRCHAQKLSCKRIGDGICERCLRLNAECKSSPSLRYKKQLQHYDQEQEQKPQPQQHQQQQQQQSSPQSLLQQHSQDLQQQQPPPRLDFSQGQNATPQDILNLETQQHIEAQDSTERRSPKRRRTGSEVHLVQRDAAFPLLATDATMNPGMQSHLLTAPDDGAMGMAEYTVNLRNMDYMALSQPSTMQPNHLLGAQIPPSVDNYFTLHQAIPHIWATNHQSSHEAVQQHQLHPHQLGPHHHQQQPVFDQVSLPPALVVPDPAASAAVAAQQGNLFSSAQPPPQQLHQQRATPILGGRRRQTVPSLSHTTASPAERSSRSNKVQINCADFVPPRAGDLTGSYMMDQFFQIYARVRVLSAHLQRLEQGKDYSDGPNEKPNEFTVAELYKHTHQVVDVLERVAAIKSAPNGAAVQLADSPLEATDPANSMFTLSLYTRLLDILQRLFTLVRSLLAKADPKKDDTFPSWLLPEMNIGAASIGAHPAFHMSLTVQLAMQFLSRLREATVLLGLTNAVATNGNGANGAATAERRGSTGDDPVGVSFGTIKMMEGTLSKTLSELQGELNGFMDTMDEIDAMEDADKK